MPTPSDSRVQNATTQTRRAAGLAATAVLSEPDAAAAFRIATDLSDGLRTAADDVAALRSSAIGRMRHQGMSYAKIGRALGISKARAAQLSRPDSDPSALF